MAIFDPLIALDKDLTPRPLLAQSLTPNDTYTVWTLKLRRDVRFHDGTLLTAAAVKRSYEKYRTGAVTGAAAKPVQSIEVVDDLTATFTMNQPWAVFPYSLTGQGGVVPAPAMLDDPNGSRHPIGTGPFVFASWTPDASLIVTKNPSYWRAGLPYLDAVEFRPLPDANARYNSLLSRDIDVTVASTEEVITRMVAASKEGKLQTLRSAGNNDLSLVLFNTSKAPFDDLRVRRALAHAIDRHALSVLTGTDPSLSADSVFQKDSVWYEPQSDYPRYDPEEATALIRAHEAEQGPITVRLGSTDDPLFVQIAQTLEAQWKAIGVNATIEVFDQATYIKNAVTGDFQVDVWRQFGAADPDALYLWWASENATGPVVPNMARNKDPRTDAAMLRGRSTTDLATRKAAYAEVQARQTAVLPYIWLNHLRWTAAADNRVRGLEGTVLPDGSTAAPIVGAVLSITGMWIDA